MRKTILISTFIASVLTADEIKPMELYNQIAGHEGKRFTVYKDSLGIPTIGIGFNLNSKANKEFLLGVNIHRNELLGGKRLSERQVTLLYNQSLTIAFQDAVDFCPNFGRHSANVQKVLIDMSFNLGSTRLNKFVKLKEALLKRDYNTAAKEMKDSKWYNQVGNRGINLIKQIKKG